MMANRNIPLAPLFTNPALRAAFERADRDRGATVMVPAPSKPQLIGAAGPAMAWRDRLETMAGGR